jgi:hypothetical protein
VIQHILKYCNCTASRAPVVDSRSEKLDAAREREKASPPDQTRPDAPRLPTYSQSQQSTGRSNPAWPANGILTWDEGEGLRPTPRALGIRYPGHQVLAARRWTGTTTIRITPNSAAAGEVQMEGEGEGVGCYGMGCCSPHTDHRAPNTKPLVVASRAQQRRADLTVSGCAGRKHRKEDGVSDTVVREAAAAVETLRPVHYYHLSSRRYSSPIPWPVLLGRSN